MVANKVLAFILINLIALLFFMFFYQSKAISVADLYEFDNVTLKVLDIKKKYPISMPTLKIAHTEWRTEEIAKWFETKISDVNNPVKNENSYALKDGKGTVTISSPQEKQFISFISNTAKKDLKPVKSILNKVYADRFASEWLNYKGRLPWDAKVHDFKPITRLSNDERISQIIGFDIEYTHNFENFLIVDDLIKLEITENDVLSYYRQWSRIIGPLDRPKNIITHKEALGLFAAHIKEDISKSININSIDLVFYNPSLYFGSNARYSDILYPAWKISVQEGGAYIIDAYDGSIRKKY